MEWLIGRLQLSHISIIRKNQRRIIGYIPKGDGTQEEINRVIPTDEFLQLLEEGLIIYF